MLSTSTKRNKKRTLIVKKGRVGRKGELFPPKEVREEAGLQPGDLVTFAVRPDGRIEVQKVLSLKQAFAQKKFARINFKEFEEMTDEVMQAVPS